jgi:preprotein translocase subunit SecG
MTFLIIILTIVLMVDCLLLGLLILIQLPKKEAGLGVAFGGGATDALFGAGSGNALTKLTKYSAIIFGALIVILSVLQARVHNGGHSGLRNAINSAPMVEPQTPPTPPQPAATAATNSPAPASNGPALLFNPAGNAVPAAGTNTPSSK